MNTSQPICTIPELTSMIRFCSSILHSKLPRCLQVHSVFQILPRPKAIYFCCNQILFSRIDEDSFLSRLECRLLSNLSSFFLFASRNLLVLCFYNSQTFNRIVNYFFESFLLFFIINFYMKAFSFML